ncbi:MAG: 30S ribosomal protein S2 [Proteobacteria bacterium]|nr:30S ribosomal protein S2 [Pseudomonadota bacterium]
MKKLSLNFDGVKNMKGLPDALFVIDVENENIAVEEALKMGIPVYGLVDTNSNPKNLTNFVPINDDSSKTIKFVLDILSEGVLDGQDSARKQGLVQKLDGDKGPKVFSLNATTKKVSVKPVEENVEKEKDVVLSQEPEVQKEQPAGVEEKAEAKETSVKVTKSALAKLTKAELEEKAKELGVAIEGKVLKADLVEQVFKAQ